VEIIDAAMSRQKEIVSPAASIPEMKFEILAGNDLKELNQLKKSDS
jgi:hypothetical protein